MYINAGVGMASGIAFSLPGGVRICACALFSPIMYGSACSVAQMPSLAGCSVAVCLAWCVRCAALCGVMTGSKS